MRKILLFHGLAVYSHSIWRIKIKTTLDIFFYLDIIQTASSTCILWAQFELGEAYEQRSREA